MNNKFLKMALAGLVLSVIGFANATLIGDNVDCNISAGGSFTCSLSTNTVVKPGIEFYVGGGDVISVDIGASVVDFEFLVGGSLSATIINLTDLYWIDMPLGEIVGFSLNNVAGINDFLSANVSFSAHSLSVDLIGTSFMQVHQYQYY